MSNFRDRMRELREEKGLTQQGLADAINIGKSAIALYETDKRQPDPHTLQKFADFFGVTIDYLLGRSDIRRLDQKENNNTYLPPQKPNKLYDVIARAEDLPEENLDQVVDALEALIKHHEEKMKNKRKTK